VNRRAMSRSRLSPVEERRVLRHCAVAVAEISALAEELVGEEHVQPPAVRAPLAIDFQQGKLMNRRALRQQQRLDILTHVEQALDAVRKAIEVEPQAGPILVAAYRALSALGELREVADALPVIEQEEKP
jgi:hypothetical protein